MQGVGVARAVQGNGSSHRAAAALGIAIEVVGGDVQTARACKARDSLQTVGRGDTLHERLDKKLELADSAGGSTAFLAMWTVAARRVGGGAGALEGGGAGGRQRGAAQQRGGAASSGSEGAGHCRDSTATYNVTFRACPTWKLEAKMAPDKYNSTVPVYFLPYSNLIRRVMWAAQVPVDIRPTSAQHVTSGNMPPWHTRLYAMRHAPCVYSRTACQGYSLRMINESYAPLGPHFAPSEPKVRECNS
ncbi:hypothetical protein GGX14DRAFT_404171 [Mycena pura]|uniref:Uncharacterized protein n=1 Tax=Mycena pura TaxID=153505 RepID=A0AAD6Y1Y3_9AGAR|nr:hypothetical protein GGX14DRAFT_404171 [Mycena pura]